MKTWQLSFALCLVGQSVIAGEIQDTESKSIYNFLKSPLNSGGSKDTSNYYHPAEMGITKEPIERLKRIIREPIERLKLDTCNERADILFVMDASGSVGSINFQTQLEFAARFVDTFVVGTSEFSVIRYDDTASIIFPFNRYTDAASLKDAILAIPYTSGGTNTAYALAMAREQAFLQSNGARPGVARIAIVSTDGMSNYPDSTTIEAQKLKDSNVLVLAMGVGNYVNTDELDRISSYPEDVFLVPDYDRLLTIVQDYSKLVCDEVKLFQCYNKSDVYFLFDASSKIPQAQFQNAINYATSITTRFDLSLFSFGAATFGGTDVKSVFKLGQITDGSQLTKTLSTAAYTGGTTDTDAALKYIINQGVFNPAEGGRPDALKILLLFTDGGSVTRAHAQATAKDLTATGVKIITVGVSIPDMTELQELVELKTQDAITNLSLYIDAYNRIATLTGLDVCISPNHSLRGAEDACRLYNWGNGTHAHPYDCNKYIECTLFKTDIISCPPKQAYDPDIKACNNPEFIKTRCMAQPNRNSTYAPPIIITSPPTTQKTVQKVCSATELSCENGQLAYRDCSGRCFCVCSSVYAGPRCEIRVEANLCDSCLYNNGHYTAGVNGYCDLYVNCVPSGGVSTNSSARPSSFVPYVMHCPPGTFYVTRENGWRGCDFLGNGHCTSDQCPTMADNARYTDYSSCQSYWQCGAGRRLSTRGCCPPGQRFDPSTSSCIVDSSCQATCGVNFTSSCGESNTTVDPGCPFAVNPINPNEYYHKAAPGSPYKCHPNMIMDVRVCLCVQAQTGTTACQPTINLTFEQQSSSLENNVPRVIAGGSYAGNFSGTEDIILKAFAGSGFWTDYFQINLRVFLPFPVPCCRRMALVDNADCNTTESVAITMDHQNIYLTIYQINSNQPVEIVIPYNSLRANSDGSYSITLVYRRVSGGFEFSGTVGSTTVVYSGPIALTSNIDMRTCAVHVGQGYQYSGLVAYVDDVQIWRCDPKTSTQG